MTIKFAPLVIIGVVVLGAAIGAAAQKVYRCGPDGRTYQQTACPEGKAVDASDPRTAEQRQAAQAVAKSEAQTAAQFDRDVMAPASAAKGGKSKSAAASPDKAASSAKSGSKKAEAEAKPQVFLVPKPKNAASAAK